MKHVNVSVKINHNCKKDYWWNLSKCICKTDRYLESTDNELVVMCKEIISIVKSDRCDKYFANNKS